MKEIEFPIFQTKIKEIKRSFDLSDPQERKEYFKIKAGKEIEKLRKYLEKNTFIAYLLGKKNSGKGTYSKLFIETVSPQRIDHFSIGDMVRKIEKEMKRKKKKREILEFLEKNYRGYTPLRDALLAFQKRSIKNLLPTELILALVKREIQKRERKALFIDGFPRNLDQISYSLFFRDLIDYREDPDIFVLIDVPEVVIENRMKWRVICPKCQTPRNLKLFITKKIEYDQKEKKFYLICENPKCKGARMVQKEGDTSGLSNIRERLKLDEKLIKQTFSLHGIPKILLRNSVPVEVAEKYIDDYEITPEYSFRWDEKEKKVEVSKRPFVFKDDKGRKSYSLLAPPVTIALIKQLVKVLDL